MTTYETILRTIRAFEAEYRLNKGRATRADYRDVFCFITVECEQAIALNQYAEARERRLERKGC